MKPKFYTPSDMAAAHWRKLGYAVRRSDLNEHGRPSDDFVERHEHLLWESDPDYVRANDYQIPFREIDREKGEWLVFEEDTECIDILKRWLNHEGRDTLFPRCDWEQCDNAVAYRGGSGYIYSITIF